MNFIILVSILKNILGSTENKIILEFADGKTSTIEENDIAYKSFPLIYSKIDKNSKVNLTSMKKETFDMIRFVYQNDGFVVLSDNEFSKFISEIDFLGIKENLILNTNEVCGETNPNAIMFMINNLNSLLDQEIGSDEYFDTLKLQIQNICKIKSSGLKNQLLLKLFEKSLQSFKKEGSIEFKNNLLRVYSEEKENLCGLSSVRINKFERIDYLKNDEEIEKLIQMFVPSLNLSEIFYYNGKSFALILLFDTFKSVNFEDKNNLFKILDIINEKSDIESLCLFNYLKDGDDLSIFNVCKNLKSLRIYNQKTINLKMYDLKLDNLEELSLCKTIISKKELFLNSIFNNLDQLTFLSCSFIDDQEATSNIQDGISCKNLILEDCKIDEMLFNWYDKIEDISKLTLINNHLDKRQRPKSSNGKLSIFKNDCFSEDQMKLLLEKKTLKEVFLSCCKHKFYLKWKSNQ